MATPPKPKELLPRDERWLGQFSPLGVPLAIVGRLANSSITFKEDGHLLWDTIAIKSPSLPWQQIKLVGLREKEWHVAPMIEMEHVQSWWLWL